jgi:chaperonin GroES
MKPLGDRVIVRRVKEKPLSEILEILEIPDAAKEKPVEGEVLSLGLKVSDPFLQVGKRVLFGKYSGADVKIKGEEFLILRKEEILVVL